MKHNILAALSIAVLLFSASCSKKNEKLNINAGNELSDLPAWVLDPTVESGIGAVGIASPSRGGIKFQIPKAELDAKANIAATIQSDISRITKNSLRSAKTNDIDDVEDFFAQATKEVIKNLPLSGIKRLNIFKAKDGSLYIHMVLTKEDYSDFLRNSQKIVNARAQNSGLARDSINATQEAAKELFDELEKERTN